MTRRCTWGLTALAFLLAVATGCSVERRWTIYPDGSGKVVESMAIDPAQAEMMKAMAGGAGGPGGPGGEKPEGGDPSKMKGTIEGKVQFVHTSYFEDLNKVSDAATTCEWKKRDDGGYDLKMTVDVEKMKQGATSGMKNMPGMPGMPGGGKEGGKEGGGQQGPDMGAMMGSQMKFSVTIVMPGEVTANSPGTKQGRKVTVPIETGDDAKEKTVTITVSCGAPDEKKIEGEMKRFKTELENAKKGQEAEEEGK